MAAKAATRWANAGVKARAEQKRTASANPPQRSSSGGNNRRAVLLSGASLLSLCEVPQQAIGDDKPPPSEYTGAASPPALRDRRKERDEVDRGVYQPRRNYSNYKPRGEGETRFAYEKLSPEETEKRASESIERIRNKVPELVEKKYWQDAQNELRRQIGTLRFDLSNIADSKNLSRDRNKELLGQLEELDYALRQKDQEQAREKIEPLRREVDQLLS